MFTPETGELLVHMRDLISQDYYDAYFEAADYNNDGWIQTNTELKYILQLSVKTIRLTSYPSSDVRKFINLMTSVYRQNNKQFPSYLRKQNFKQLINRVHLAHAATTYSLADTNSDDKADDKERIAYFNDQMQNLNLDANQNQLQKTYIRTNSETIDANEQKLKQQRKGGYYSNQRSNES